MITFEEAKQEIAEKHGYRNWYLMILKECRDSYARAEAYINEAVGLLSPEDIVIGYTDEYEMFEAHGLQLVQTCGACPEQYDVFKDSEQIGYFRLRHGYFRAEYKGTTVYDAHPDGDGAFEQEERIPHLYKAMKALLKEFNSEYLLS